MPRFRLKSAKLGWGPVGGEVEIRQRDRDLLYPLFVYLRDRRMLLSSPVARLNSYYTQHSVEEIRDELTSTLATLDPNSEARPWLERLRAACRALVDVDADDPTPKYLVALDEMLEAFRIVAEHVAAVYRLSEARELAGEIRAAQRSR